MKTENAPAEVGISFLIMKLSKQLKRGRIDRPDEWTMDRYIRKATEAEEAILELVAITEDMSNGQDVGNRLIAARSVADEILEDNNQRCHGAAVDSRES